MSRRTKREMAPPPHQTGSAPSYHIGSAPASAIQVPTPVPAVLGGGSPIPSTGGQPAAWWPGPLPQATSSVPTSTNWMTDDPAVAIGTQPTLASMNPLLLALACSGSWQALSFLLDKEGARASRSEVVSTQAFHEVLEDSMKRKGGANASKRTQQASDAVEEGFDQATLPAALLLLEGVTSEGDTALHVVATYGDGEGFLRSAEVICRMDKRLLFAINKKGETPLHCAARAGKSRMISVLIDLAGGEKKLLRAENMLQETALHNAVRTGNKDIVEVLMTADAELACFPEDGTSPLYLAIMQERVDITHTLYDKSCGNLSYSGPDGQNALHVAVLRSPVLTEMLVRWNKDLTGQRDRRGSTPLHFATSMLRAPYLPVPRVLDVSMLRVVPTSPIWHSDIPFKLVLEANLASMYQSDDKGMFPIHIAALRGVNKAVVKFIELCPNIAGLRDAKGRTFLHIAVENKRRNIVEHACQTSSLTWTLNMQDKDGSTALQLAVNIGDLGMFCSLLENPEVCLNIANNNGETPLDLSASKLPFGFSFAWNPICLIYLTLMYCCAKRGNRRWDHFEEQYIHQQNANDKEKDSAKVTNSTQTLSIGSVLIATVAFGATFTLPGGYKDDGTPTFSGRYVFEAFITANSLAFACSGLATINLMYAGLVGMDLPMRFWHFNVSLFLALSSVTSLAAAFALGLYLMLTPVAHITATAVCVVASVMSLYGYRDPTRGHAVARVLRLRMGNQGLMICARIIFAQTLITFWPLIITFSWAAIATKYHHIYSTK